jgi:hypothetical protein
MRYNRVIFATIFLALLGLMVGSQPAWSQATVGTGSIQGTVTDPQGAVVSGARVTITNLGTSQSSSSTTTSAGTYSSGPLAAGNYKVRVDTPNFKATEKTMIVQIGVISPGDISLELGSASSVVEVTSSAVSVNTEQSEVSGTLTSDQIENLPINGRNFLDLAQLEPGVQIQDGSDFDPTKTGFSSISFGGRFGRTARIEVDGVDVSDETVGTTTTNIPAGAIAEFQLAQSNLDLSNELTSSGAVNVATKSGTNTYHGGAFGLFRDSTEGAALPGNGSYQRSQYGGDFGGAIIPDKLFFFMDAERDLQHAAAGLSFAPPFNVFNGSFQSPYRDELALGRLDWQATKNVHVFSRYNFFSNNLVPSFGTPSFSFFGNKDRSRVFAGGVDFTTGSFTHSFRAEYLKFVNNIADAVRGSGAPFDDFPVGLDFPSTGFSTGPSPDAPQYTFQSDRQIKYDGSKLWGSHDIRFGVAFNHIQGGGYASFFGIASQAIDEQFSTASGGTYNSYLGPLVSAANCLGQSGEACPLNYTPDLAYVGNGLGYSSEKPAFGKPFGGNGPDNRIGLYVGDSWKVRPSFTLQFGVRYTRDTGRTDSDLNTLEVVNNYLPGYGNPVRQPNADFGPEAGFAWNVKGDGKTVIRGGMGLYYENAIWNNVLFDRPGRLPSGAFLSYQLACNNGVTSTVQFADGSSQQLPALPVAGPNGTTDMCSNAALGEVLPAGTSNALINCSGITVGQCIANFEGDFQTTALAHPTGANSSYIPNQIAAGAPVTGGAGTFAPNYKAPRSVQMNIGLQRELRPGMVLTVDYLRNVGTHYLLNIDQNHTGDAAYLNVPAAQSAIATTNSSFGCGASFSTAATSCAVLAGATISDYSGNGLDSPIDISGGSQCGGGLAASSSVPCAFGGVNPLIGEFPFLEPVGRAVYNAMDVKWQDNVHNPMPGIRYFNFQVSYTLSRFQNSGSSDPQFATGTAGTADQDFINNSLDNRDPLRYMGDSTLDRTHQLNFGGWATLPGGFQLGIISHMWSPLAITPTTNGSGTGGIFTTDFTGDGTTSDPLPIAQTSSSCGTVGGTCDYTTYRSGAFGRSLGPTGLAKAIANYDSTIAGKTITPAGQALVNAGLMTEAQLIAIGAAPQSIPESPANPAGLRWLRALDLQVSYHHSFFNERLVVTPSFSCYNLFNFANFDAPLNILSGALGGTPGTINGTTRFTSLVDPVTGRSDVIGNGTGVFAFGAPRALEWGMKFDF